jgi:hypothetical protein
MQLERPRRWWEDNIKLRFREVRFGRVDWIRVAQNRELLCARWRTFGFLKSGQFDGQLREVVSGRTYRAEWEHVPCRAGTRTVPSGNTYRAEREHVPCRAGTRSVPSGNTFRAEREHVPCRVGTRSVPSGNTFRAEWEHVPCRAVALRLQR